MSRSLARIVSALLPLAMIGVVATGCSTVSRSETPAKQLALILQNTQSKIATVGSVASSITQSDLELTEVYDPKDNGGMFVNDSVLTGSKQEFKQISRQARGNMKSSEIFMEIGSSKVGEIVYYATTNFEVLENKISESKDGFLQSLKLHDVDGNRGTFRAIIEYKVEQGLITNVKFAKDWFNKSDPEEVCLYAPTNCISNVSFSFDSKRVVDKMKEAFTKYEVSQNLSSGTNQQHFESIMRKMDSTVAEYKSWTTVNEGKTIGSVFDSSRDKGVKFDIYGEPAEIKGVADLNGRQGPDNGFVSGLFFDTTDGGSTYFYGPISFDANTGIYSIYDTQNTLVANLHFAGNKLIAFNNNFLWEKDKFSISKEVDTDLLHAYLAKVPRK